MPEFRKITIEPAGNGYIIRVGCAVFVSETVERMFSELARYLKSCKDVEAEYIKAGNVGRIDTIEECRSPFPPDVNLAGEITTCR